MHGLLGVVRQPEQHLRYFGIQFGTLRSRGARTAHAALYNSLPALPSIAAAPQLAELARVAKVLEGLNTYAEDQLEELDYDRRLDAYAELPRATPEDVGMSSVRLERVQRGTCHRGRLRNRNRRRLEERADTVLSESMV